MQEARKPLLFDFHIDQLEEATADRKIYSRYYQQIQENGRFFFKKSQIHSDHIHANMSFLLIIIIL